MGQRSEKGISLSVVIPWILSLITAGIGIWQFAVQQMQANRQPFLEKQLELAFEASATASRLATVADPADWEKARLHFWLLYWGPLSIIENPAVEGKMIEFGKLVPKEPDRRSSHVR